MLQFTWHDPACSLNHDFSFKQEMITVTWFNQHSLTSDNKLTSNKHLPMVYGICRRCAPHHQTGTGLARKAKVSTPHNVQNYKHSVLYMCNIHHTVCTPSLSHSTCSFFTGTDIYRHSNSSPTQMHQCTVSVTEDINLRMSTCTVTDDIQLHHCNWGHPPGDIHRHCNWRHPNAL